MSQLTCNSYKMRVILRSALVLFIITGLTSGLPPGRVEKDDYNPSSPETEILQRIYKVINEELSATKDEEAMKASEFLARRYFSNSRKKQGPKDTQLPEEAKDSKAGYKKENLLFNPEVPISPNPEIPKSSAKVEYPVLVQKAPATASVEHVPTAQEYVQVAQQQQAPAVQEQVSTFQEQVPTASAPQYYPQIIFLSPDAFLQQQQLLQQQQQPTPATPEPVTAATEDEEEKEKFEIENPNALHAIKHLLDALHQGGVNRVKNELNGAEITTPKNPAIGILDTSFNTLQVFVGCQLFRNCE